MEFTLDPPNLKFGPAIMAAIGCIDQKDLATAAADNKGHGQLFHIEVRDQYQQEIVVGHVTVAVIYGSIEATQKTESAICATCSRIYPLGGGER